MSLIVIGLASAAAASLGAALIARAVRRRRASEEPERPEATALLDSGASGTSDSPMSETEPLADLGLSVAVGDVVQHELESRWPRAGLLLRDDADVRMLLLLCEEGGESLAVAVQPAPNRQLLWLKRSHIAFPSTPPSCVELEGQLLDRRASFPATFSCVGRDSAQLTAQVRALAGSNVRLALYEGALQDAAVILQLGDTVMAWYGRKLTTGEYDVLGQVDKPSA